MISAMSLASISKTLWQFVFCWGVFFPAGTGLVFYTPIVCGWEWFPDNKGLVSGLIAGGYGFGAFIFGFLTTRIANP